VDIGVAYPGRYQLYQDFSILGVVKLNLFNLQGCIEFLQYRRFHFHFALSFTGFLLCWPYFNWLPRTNTTQP
jgi:hypothetical protein